MSTINEIAQLLSKNIAFQELAEETLYQLIEQSEQVFYPSEQAVFYESDKAHSMYIVLSGCIDISTINEDGREIILN